MKNTILFLAIATAAISCNKIQPEPTAPNVKDTMFLFENDYAEELPYGTDLQMTFTSRNIEDLKFTISNNASVLFFYEMEDGCGKITIRAKNASSNGDVCYLYAESEGYIMGKKKFVVSRDVPEVTNEIDFGRVYENENHEFVNWTSSKYIKHDLSLCLAWSKAQAMHYDDAFITKGSAGGTYELGTQDSVEPRTGYSPDMSRFNSASSDNFLNNLNNAIISPGGQTMKVYEKENTYIYTILK